VRRSLQNECGDYLPEELATITIQNLLMRVEFLKGAGGTITGFDLAHFERVLKLVTSTAAELKALDAAARKRAAA
jgi:hypothetical protein